MHNTPVYKFRNKSFSGYGLNKFKNFLSTPMRDCGCSGKGRLIVKTKEELFDFISNSLFEVSDIANCYNCAIFAHAYDEQLYIGIKELAHNEENVHILKSDIVREPFFFSRVDASFCFEKYALMIETLPGIWEVIED